MDRAAAVAKAVVDGTRRARVEIISSLDERIGLYCTQILVNDLQYVVCENTNTTLPEGMTVTVTHYYTARTHAFV